MSWEYEFPDDWDEYTDEEKSEWYTQTRVARQAYNQAKAQHETAERKRRAEQKERFQYK